MSRSYYGAYHAARAWYEPLVPGTNGAGPVGGVHQQFINCLRNPAPENEAEVRRFSKVLGAQLDVVKIQRHMADYDLDATVEKLQAENLLRLCESIVVRVTKPAATASAHSLQPLVAPGSPAQTPAAK
ncbi:hypothetical protein RCH10_003799 [Variovorax sp. GrIS 2.14]|uniref:hypothetical protein n=1 Tax=Variovorax sp. GrIS 2.14 TaxID=3071709 RepID=UPI0038F7875C